MSLAQQGGEDRCRGLLGLLVGLSQESRVELVKLSHLSPESLEAERRKEAGAEGWEAGGELRRLRGGWSLGPEEVGPGQEDGPLLLGHLVRGLRPGQPGSEHGGQGGQGGG